MDFASDTGQGRNRSLPTSYDETPYPSGPYQQSHPDRLETLATLFGMTPADIRDCRVLELGASDGSNLIPIACAHPHSRFVGVDLSRRSVEAGLEDIATLGLSNIELKHLDIADVDQSFGAFDYVIAHGVYSWVPSAVQQRIFEICSNALNENGVAYVSYNTNPGWRMRGLVRDMMLYHLRKFDDAAVRIEQARALVRWLAETLDGDPSPHAVLLKREADLMNRWPDAYLRHDSLGEINEPVYFHEFIERAEWHGLQYLAESELSAMIASNYGSPVDEALNKMGRDIIELEQYMDFLRNRLFRQTLLCHRGVKLNRALGAWSVQQFHIAASLRFEPDALDFAPNVVATFRGARDLTVSSGQPLVKAALACLSEAWPESIQFSELLAQARALLSSRGVALAGDTAQEHADRGVLGGAVLSCYTKGLCELHVHPPEFARGAGERPRACPLVALQARRGDAVTNRRHERVLLDAVGRGLLPLLDGTRDRKALLDAATSWQGASAEDGGTRDTAAAAAAELDSALALYGRQALLVG